MITYRLAQNTPEDRGAFVALSNSLYARKVDDAYVAWQFFSCPFPCHLTIACDDEKVIGAYAVHLVGGTKDWAPFAMSLDIMIAAGYQGQGLIKPLAEHALSYAKHATPTVIANSKAQKAMSRHLGWDTWQTLSDWDFAGQMPETPDLSVSNIDWPAAEILGSIAQHAHTPTLYPRDAATLTWRLKDNKRYSYQWHAVVENSGSVAGYAISKAFTDPSTGEKYIDILDVFAFPGTTDLNLLQAITAHLTKAAPATISLYPNRGALLAAAETLRYCPSSRQRYWCGKGQIPATLGVGKLDVDVF